MIFLPTVGVDTTSSKPENALPTEAQPRPSTGLEQGGPPMGGSPGSFTHAVLELADSWLVPTGSVSWHQPSCPCSLDKYARTASAPWRAAMGPFLSEFFLMSYNTHTGGT